MSFKMNIFNELSKSTSGKTRDRAVGDISRFASRMSYAKMVTGTFSGLIGLALVGATFGGQEVFATASSLTLSISGNPTIELPPSAEGKFADSGDQTISVSTTHAAGYVLKVKASDTTTLKNTSGTVGFTSISSAISEETFDTSAYNGKWGYKPSKLNGAENTNYLPSPTTTGSTIDSVSSATSNNYTVSIGARADINTAIDNYSNTFVFTVTANPTPYTITYNANTTDTVSNMPSNVDSTTSGNVTIASNTPTRDGYNFQGWCTAQVADGASCTGVSYAAGETFEIDQTATSNTLTLYAQWKEEIITKFTAGAHIETIIVADSTENYKPYYATDGNDVELRTGVPGTEYIVTVVPYPGYILSEWTGATDGLASTSYLTTTYTANETGDLAAEGESGSYEYMQYRDCLISSGSDGILNVTDIRDGKSYAIGMDSDGNCSMLSNLRLDNVDSNGNPVVLDDFYSDIGSVTYEDPQTGESVTTTTFTMPTESWTSREQDYYCKAMMTKVNNEYYYNWYAAKANPYNCESPTERTNATEQNDSYSLGSICPKNWTLPEVDWDWSKEWQMPITSGTFSMMYDGQDSVGSYGWWWSSKRDGEDNGFAFGLRFDGGSVLVDSRENYIGSSVRCVIR